MSPKATLHMQMVRPTCRGDDVPRTRKGAVESHVISLGSQQVHVRADAIDTQSVAGGVVLAGRTVEVDAPDQPRRFYRHGWQSWSPTRWLDVDEPLTPVTVPELQLFDDDPAYALAERHGGAVVGAVEHDGGVLLIGALGISGRVELTGAGLFAGSETTDRWFVAHGNEADVFAAYADALGNAVGRRPLVDRRVWCSWYSFYESITESAVDAVLGDLDGFDFDVFQVDDGWQRHVGDWEANDDFRSGMPALADRIREAGCAPGLWLAPLLVHDDSQTFADHPEWVLRDDTGRPAPAGWNWSGRVHALDTTHPDALAHVCDVLRVAVAWGYRYLKLDFLFAGALPGVRRHPVERHRAYRDAIEAFRDAVGGDVVLLACGAPVIPSLGVFDAIRVGPDVAELWENDHASRYLHVLSTPQARYAVATSVHRLWLQPLIGTDPDVAYFRTRYCLLSDAQKRLVQDLTRVCRFRATSDIPATLDPDERTALAAYLAEEVDVRQLGRYRWVVGERVVDFGPVAGQAPVMLPVPGAR